jgi:hypothetical protein
LSKLPAITSAFQDPFVCSGSLFNPESTCTAVCHVIGPGLVQNWSARCSENGTVEISSSNNCSELVFDHNGVGYLPRHEVMPWSGAVQAAYQFTYKGQHGQLPLVTDMVTNNFLCELAPGEQIYTAGMSNDRPSAINFYWTAAPMRGINFFNGRGSSGSAVNGMFTNFMANQPDGISGCVYLYCLNQQKKWYVIYYVFQKSNVMIPCRLVSGRRTPRSLVVTFQPGNISIPEPSTMEACGPMGMCSCGVGDGISGGLFCDQLRLSSLPQIPVKVQVLQLYINRLTYIPPEALSADLDQLILRTNLLTEVPFRPTPLPLIANIDLNVRAFYVLKICSNFMCRTTL